MAELKDLLPGRKKKETQKLSLTYRRLLNVVDAMRELAAQPLAVKTVLRVQASIRSFNDATGKFFEARDALSAKYNEDGEPDLPLSAKMEVYPKLSSEIEALLEETVQVEFQPVTVRELEAEGDIRLSAVAMLALMEIGQIVDVE